MLPLGVWGISINNDISIRLSLCGMCSRQACTNNPRHRINTPVEDLSFPEIFRYDASGGPGGKGTPPLVAIWAGASDYSRLAICQALSSECPYLCYARARVFVPCIRFIFSFPARLCVPPILLVFVLLFVSFPYFCRSCLALFQCSRRSFDNATMKRAMVKFRGA